MKFAPESAQAKVYARLAKNIEGNESRCVPSPLAAEELEALMRRYGL